MNAARPFVALLALLALGIAAPSPSPSSKPSGAIAIVINGQTLPLNPPPRFEKNVLMVPVRRIIEALGLAFVKQGDRITTQIGSKNIAITVGSTQAQVDGQSVTLDAAPIEIQYVLYAPLRFFTDVLGAQARYDRASNAVAIVAQLVGRSGVGYAQNGDHIERFGTVAAVDVLSNPPTITIGDNGAVKTIPISPNATIDIEDVSANVTQPGELGDVRPGDFARVTMRKNGTVERVTDAFGTYSGTIVAVAGNQFVMGDGQVIGAARSTEISLNGKAASFSDLRPLDVVSVRYNVETNEVREVLASRAVASAALPSAGVAITGIDADAGRPLRAGDSFSVTLRGTPGGSATFDIGSYVTNLAMHEGPAGVYTASYTIPQGANFSGVPIIGHLSVRGASAPDAQAASTLSASSTPPGVSDFAPQNDAWVNNRRPAIYATFAADAVPVNPSSVTLVVNGRDVSAQCVRTQDYVQYLPDYTYPDGPVRVTVRVSDRAGNTTSKSWSFTIRAR